MVEFTVWATSSALHLKNRVWVVLSVDIIIKSDVGAPRKLASLLPWPCSRYSVLMQLLFTTRFSSPVSFDQGLTICQTPSNVLYPC